MKIGEIATEQELIDNWSIQKKIQYENLDGKNYAVLMKKIGENKTFSCPFCNNTHLHGEGEGHRLSHCSDTSFPPYNNSNSRWIVCNGILFSQKDGYIIRNQDSSQ